MFLPPQLALLCCWDFPLIFFFISLTSLFSSITSDYSFIFFTFCALLIAWITISMSPWNIFIMVSFYHGVSLSERIEMVSIGRIFHAIILTHWPWRTSTTLSHYTFSDLRMNVCSSLQWKFSEGLTWGFSLLLLTQWQEIWVYEVWQEELLCSNWLLGSG